MRSVDEYLNLILESIAVVEPETVALHDAHLRTLRTSVTSSVDLPPWPNSAMDGYAVKVTDLESASTDNPITLPVLGDIPAGTTTQTTLQSGTAFRIMTGAPIPEVCDAVVQLEKTLEWNETHPTADAPLPESITFTEPVAPGLNIRQQGEDIRSGDTVLEAGVKLFSNRTAALAAVGVTEVNVEKVIKVAVISTGTELVQIGQPLEFGQIYDSNSTLLATLVRESGADISLQTHVCDNADELRDTVVKAQKVADVIILTGGASVGAHDTTRFVLDMALPQTQEHNLRCIEFTKVAMQPGKPQGFGQLSDGTYVWALPGNPVSVWVSFLMFVEPALLKLQGVTNYQPSWQPVHVSRGWRSPLGREQIMPICVTSGSGENITVAPVTSRGSGSHLAATLANATGIVRVPAEVSEVSENDVVLMRGLHR